MAETSVLTIWPSRQLLTPEQIREWATGAPANQRQRPSDDEPKPVSDGKTEAARAW